MNNSTQLLNKSDVFEFHCPRYHELPHIPLYKDQVIAYIEEALKDVTLDSGEKLLTPTMLNNYVKQKVVNPPKDKKYNEKHLAYLIVVCVLKQVFSLTEICRLITIQIGTCPIEQAYNLFCIELEAALNATITTRKFLDPRPNDVFRVESEVLRSAVMAFANKFFVQRYLINDIPEETK